MALARVAPRQSATALGWEATLPSWDEISAPNHPRLGIFEAHLSIFREEPLQAAPLKPPGLKKLLTDHRGKNLSSWHLEKLRISADVSSVSY